MKKIIQVLLPTLQNKSIFDYYSTKVLEIGTIIKVPFRKKEIEGIVWSDTKSNDTVPAAKIKNVLQTFEDASLSPYTLKFIKFISEYNLLSLGSVLKLFFPFPNLNFLNKDKEYTPIKIQKDLPILNKEQTIALEKIRAATIQKPIKPVLLEGVTGSGKTEVYLHAIYDALNRDTAQTLVLLPEIMLTNHLLERFKKNLGLAAEVWHSDVSLKNKKQIWKKVLNGSCQLVIGARSALFLPFKNLKLIVIDEEHDQSYKQEDGLVYNARDMAVAYGYIAQIPVILSSATPSLETFYNVIRGKYLKAELTSRYHNVSPPKISIVDMKEEDLTQSKWLSKTLIDKTTKTLEQDSQVIFFLNRKGYAPIIFCRACEHKVSCPNCSIHLVMYKDSNNKSNSQKLLCHHCGYNIVYPDSCPACQSRDTLINCGPGVDQLFEEAKKIWPDKNIQRITRDSIKTNNDSEDILNEMLANKIDILIGTQILSKGYHFPNLNLVGIVDADIGLSGADLKAAERTHQLLTQVSGRSGRETKGEVLIQTNNPDNTLLDALKTYNKKMFYEEELRARQMMNMSPFSKLVALIFSGTDEEKLKTSVKNFAEQIPYTNEIEVLGPAPAPIAKIRKHYRYRFLIKSAPKINLQKYIHNCTRNFKLPTSIRLKIDFDPYNFL